MFGKPQPIGFGANNFGNPAHPHPTPYSGFGQNLYPMMPTSGVFSAPPPPSLFNNNPIPPMYPGMQYPTFMNQNPLIASPQPFQVSPVPSNSFYSPLTSYHPNSIMNSNLNFNPNINNNSLSKNYYPSQNPKIQNNHLV